MRRLLAALGAVVLFGACYDFSTDLETCRAAGGCMDAALDSGSAGGAGGGTGGGVGGGAGGGGGGGGVDGGASDGGEVDGGFDAGRVTTLKPCSAGGFCPENPVPTSDHLNAVYGLSANDVWFVGNDGIIVHYDGEVFEAIDSGVTKDLRDVWVAPTGEVFVVGQNGAYLRGQLDGGFFEQPGAPAIDLYAVTGTSKTHVELGGVNGSTWLDDGIGVLTQTYGIDGGTVSALAGTPTETLAVTLSGRIFRRTTQNWIEQTPAGPTAVLRDVIAFPDGGALAVGSSGLQYFRVAGGWARVDGGSANSFTSVSSPPNSSNVYLTKFDGQVTLLANPGQALFDNTVTRPSGNQSQELYGSWAADETNVFVAGAFGVIAKGNFQQSFVRVPENTPRHRLNAVWARTGGEAWAVGYNGLIRHRVGTRWVTEQLQLLPNANLFAVTGDATRVFAAGQQGNVFERGPGGVWQSLPSTGVPGDLYAALMVGPVLYVAASNGAVLRYPAADGGWEQEPTGVSLPLRALAVENNGMIVAAGDARTVIRFDGGTWDAVPEAANTFGSFGPTVVAVSGITVCPDGSLWASGSNVNYVFNFTAGQFYPAGASHSAIHCAFTNAVSAVGPSGVVYRRVGGSSNNPFTQTERNLHGLAPIPGTSSYLVCGEGDTILRWQ